MVSGSDTAAGWKSAAGSAGDVGGGSAGIRPEVGGWRSFDRLGHGDGRSSRQSLAWVGSTASDGDGGVDGGESVIGGGGSRRRTGLEVDLSGWMCTSKAIRVGVGRRSARLASALCSKKEARCERLKSGVGLCSRGRACFGDAERRRRASMLGLFDGKSSTHFKAISRNPSISFTSISPISFTASVSSSLSKTSLPFPSPTLIFTHPTRFVSPKSSLSVGRRPVMISSNTTPNEYTSPLAVHRKLW
ncbi:hypothetical protein M5K25_020211 [Dendrobium thyrsiflorum]|uniref:Uncharacterized protein n=1 Tax=Dendrobium thyrsiflorum TaxID=117978 RepID=A0ABD0U9H2_DENTH